MRLHFDEASDTVSRNDPPYFHEILWNLRRIDLERTHSARRFNTFEASKASILAIAMPLNLQRRSLIRQRLSRKILSRGVLRQATTGRHFRSSTERDPKRYEALPGPRWLRGCKSLRA